MGGKGEEACILVLYETPDVATFVFGVGSIPQLFPITAADAEEDGQSDDGDDSNTSNDTTDDGTNDRTRVGAFSKSNLVILATVGVRNLDGTKNSTVRGCG